MDKLQEKEILTLSQGAELLQISTVTLRKLIQEGQIKARKVGREWRISRQILLDWVECNEEKED